MCFEVSKIHDDRYGPFGSFRVKYSYSYPFNLSQVHGPVGHDSCLYELQCNIGQDNACLNMLNLARY